MIFSSRHNVKHVNLVTRFNAVVFKRFIILKQLIIVNITLTCRRDALLFMVLDFNTSYGIGLFYFKRDGRFLKGLNEDLHFDVCLKSL